MVTSEIASAAGLVSLAFLPDLMRNHLTGILISVIVYAVGSGLLEALISPVIAACPFEHKEAVMSMTHSFYCWGTVAVILLSTVFFHFAGIQHWPVLACSWAVVPFINIFNFFTCPLERLVEDGHSMTIPQLLKNRRFWLLAVLAVCAGASEMGIAQWASAFTESALGVSKSVGDLAGPCMFAFLMGVSRFIYGKFGSKMDMNHFMFGSGILCVLSYLMLGLSSRPVIGLLGCGLCGFSVGIMWPGGSSIASDSIKTGGTAMFALMALAINLGGSVAPSLIGFVSRKAGNNLQAGLFAGIVFPAALLVSLFLLRFRQDEENGCGGIATDRAAAGQAD